MKNVYVEINENSPLFNKTHILFFIIIINISDLTKRQLIFPWHTYTYAQNIHATQNNVLTPVCSFPFTSVQTTRYVKLPNSYVKSLFRVVLLSRLTNSVHFPFFCVSACLTICPPVRLSVRHTLVSSSAQADDRRAPWTQLLLCTQTGICFKVLLFCVETIYKLIYNEHKYSYGCVKLKL